ncbi:MAG TPA: gliding motility protein GldL [Saprospiraceae bacterium]|nr:gliding motility protein GldL [Lewinellaceae bacterium]HPK09204.1 gliding motility protein GldL [Saprospiraceae bacterium]
MSFIKSKGFKYLKNFVIGVGASVVMLGALGKINSYSWGGIAITAGLVTEAILFFFLGILGPEKDYYWEKLYPGLDDYNSNIAPLTAGPVKAGSRQLDAEVVENKLGGMLDELQTMSKSLGSLKALQEVDFSETSSQIKGMHNFYSKMNEAMSSLSDTVEDTKQYKDQMVSLNKNLSSLNSVYGNVLNAFTTKA